MIINFNNTKLIIIMIACKKVM